MMAPTSTQATRYPLVLLLAVFTLRGVALACALPPGEMWDETSHLAYVDHWSATGRAAVLGKTIVDPTFLAAMAKLPQPSSAGYGLTYGPHWAGSPAPPLPTLDLYEAQHPFLYYALVAPAYRVAGGRANLPAAVAVLRLVNLACGAAALAIVFRWLARNAPAPAALLLGCWVTLQPLLLLNVVRVANDALAFLLGTAVVVVALDLRRPRFWPRVAALAVLFPLAVLAKATNTTLLPAVILAAILAGRSRRTTVNAIGVILVGSALILAPYVISNLHTFGLPTPMGEAVANRAAGRSMWTVLTTTPVRLWPGWTMGWWLTNGLWVGGWSFLSPPSMLVRAYVLLLAMAGVATVTRWRSLPLPAATRWTAVVVVACVHLGLMLHATEAYAAWHGRVTTNPWYAAVAVPWFLILLGCGAMAVPWRPVRSALVLGVPSVFVITEAVGLIGRMLPAYYAAPPLSATCLRRMATLHPALLGPTAFAMALLGTVVVLVLIGRRAVAVQAASV